MSNFILPPDFMTADHPLNTSHTTIIEPNYARDNYVELPESPNLIIDDVPYDEIVRSMAAAMLHMHARKIEFTQKNFHRYGFTADQISWCQMDAAVLAHPKLWGG